MIPRSAYPPNWPNIATIVKEEAGWLCGRCGHPHSPESGHTLTVHHLDMDKANNAWWNLAALCQRCHLHLQATLNINAALYQLSFWPVEEWLIPYIKGRHQALIIA